MTDEESTALLSWLLKRYSDTTAELYLGMVRRLLSQGKDPREPMSQPASPNRKIAWSRYREFLEISSPPTSCSFCSRPAVLACICIHHYALLSSRPWEWKHPCRTEGCSLPQKGNGLCSIHFRLWLKGGSPRRGNRITGGHGCSGHRNVYPTRAGTWTVHLTMSGEVYSAGTFKDLAEAAQAAQKLRARVFTHHPEQRTKSTFLREKTSTRAKTRPPLEFQGESYESLSKLVQKKAPSSYNTVVSRLNRGWPLEKAVCTPPMKQGRPRTLFVGDD